MSKFRPRARLIRQLGDQLIKNESIAILELVKNSYDANAKKVFISLNNLNSIETALIEIRDNGEGMTKSIVDNVWLEIGTDYKEKLFQDMIKKEKLSQDKINKKKKQRLPLGEKGIGRFGAHKLGNRILMVTRASNSKEVVVEIDWTILDNKKYLDDFEITVFEREPEIFKKNSTGTLIRITGIRNEWIKRQFRTTYRSIVALNSPYNTIDSFKVTINTNMNSWTEGLKSFDDIKHLTLYSLNAKISKDSIIEYKYDFTPWDTMIKVNGRQNIEKPFKLFYKDELNKKVYYSLEKYEIGDIHIFLSVFDLDTFLYKTLSLETEGLRTFLKEQGGIYIYRDGIRIYEYGGSANDWLNLEERRINNPSKAISSRLALGGVFLSRKHSTGLIEKTNREGFIENQSLHMIKLAILQLIDRFEKDRFLDKKKLRKAYGRSLAKEPVTGTLNSLISLVNKDVSELKLKVNLISSLNKLSEEYDEIKSTLIRSSSSGLTSNIILHEVEKIVKEMSYTVKEKDWKRMENLVITLDKIIYNYTNLMRNHGKKSHTIEYLIEEALFNVEYRIKTHDIKIIIENNIDESIFVSENLVISMIMNIIDNAIYWLEYYDIDEKKILVSVSTRGNSIGIAISDNALGFKIDKTQATEAFVTTKSDGIGLGLFLTRETMKLHKGSLYLYNNIDLELPDEFQQGSTIECLFRRSSK